AQRWLLLAQQLGDEPMLPLIRLAWNYAYSGRYADALDTFTTARAQAASIDLTIDALTGLGWTHAYLGNYPAAVTHHQQALELAQSLQDLSRQGYGWSGLGWTYLQSGQVEAAIAAYEQQLALARQGQDRRSQANALSKLGEAYQRLDRLAEAEQALTASLALLTQLGDQRGQGYGHLRLAAVYRAQANPTAAIDQLQQTLGIHQAIGNRRGSAIALSQLGAVMAEQENPAAAIALYKQAIAVIETIRQDIDRLSREQQDLYRNTVAETYRTLVALLLSQDRFLEAQQVLELLKGNELEQFTHQARSTPSHSDLPYSNAETQLLNQQGSLIALGNQVDACLKSQCGELTFLLDQREQVNADFYAAIDRLEAEMRQRLSQDRGVLDTEDFSRAARTIVAAEPNTILIYPFVSEQGLWLLWGGPGGINGSISVPVSEAELNQTILALRHALESPTSDVTELQQLSHQLYDWLIAPLATELKENAIENLVFSLDRQLRYLPMAALFDGDHYLVERYDIHTILSADLTRTDRLDWQQVQVLAVGLSEAIAGFGALPGVPAEVDAIVREGETDSRGIFPGVALLNEAFNRTALRNQLWGHQVLHIATHGVFVAGEQEGSYLVTGDGTPLPITDIRRFEGLAQVHLVVLSACETALGGTNQDGIEISSLAYHFLNKGVQTVVASLWAVDDFSTSLLMQAFYGALVADEPVTQAEALRRAQLQLLQGDLAGAGLPVRGLGVESTAIGESRGATTPPDYRHPYYWAPFTLMGNGL
ncbi:MAG: CHAT domain-containing protein, partial [Leptolyngbya sp. RL_3_1]|nr:CHAT domain-containing protein [Leptolyngbya sp. RL_3_1]